MSTNEIKVKLKAINTFLNKLTWLPPLIGRITVGWVFLTAGWGKLHNLESVIGYFDSLGIPFASTQAPFIATLELIGGAALLLGLGTRYFSILLIGTMAVALLTAHADDISAIPDIFKIYEFTYIVIMSYLVTSGPGLISLDHLLKKKC